MNIFQKYILNNISEAQTVVNAGAAVTKAVAPIVVDQVVPEDVRTAIIVGNTLKPFAVDQAQETATAAYDATLDVADLGIRAYVGALDAKMGMDLHNPEFSFFTDTILLSPDDSTMGRVAKGGELIETGIKTGDFWTAVDGTTMAWDATAGEAYVETYEVVGDGLTHVIPEGVYDHALLDRAASAGDFIIENPDRAREMVAKGIMVDGVSGAIALPAELIDLGNRGLGLVGLKAYDGSLWQAIQDGSMNLIEGTMEGAGFKPWQAETSQEAFLVDAFATPVEWLTPGAAFKGLKALKGGAAATVATATAQTTAQTSRIGSLVSKFPGGGKLAEAGRKARDAITNAPIIGSTLTAGWKIAKNPTVKTTAGIGAVTAFSGVSGAMAADEFYTEPNAAETPAVTDQSKNSEAFTQVSQPTPTQADPTPAPNTVWNKLLAGIIGFGAVNMLLKGPMRALGNIAMMALIGLPFLKQHFNSAAWPGDGAPSVATILKTLPGLRGPDLGLD